MSKEQIDIITELLIDFDEMGFVPTTTVPDHEAYAIEWRKKLTDALQGYRKQSEGEWKSKHHMSRSSRGRYISYNTYTCNACGKANGRRKTPFCPHCGAKMKGGAE